jgi:hypothetical protein
LFIYRDCINPAKKEDVVKGVKERYDRFSGSMDELSKRF